MTLQQEEAEVQNITSLETVKYVSSHEELTAQTIPYYLQEMSDEKTYNFK